MVRNDKGLMLMELVLVVLIFSILTALAIPNFVIMQEHRREGDTKVNMQRVKDAIEHYSSLNDGMYPDAADQIESVLEAGTVNPWNNEPLTVRVYQSWPNWGEKFAPGDVIVYRPQNQSGQPDYIICAAGRDSALLKSDFGWTNYP